MTGQLRQRYFGSDQYSFDATLAPDGRTIIAAGSDGILRFWDAASATLMWTLRAHKGGITGIHFDGGYQEYMLAPAEGLAAIPEGLDAADAGPLLCAGITTFNALRHSGAGPGDLVAVQGIGGLGHLGVQWANKFGYRVAAVGRGPENGTLAKKLGAHIYIDSKNSEAAAELQKLGGAKVILATAPNSKAMSDLFPGLGRNGSMVAVGAGSGNIEVSPFLLLLGKRRLQGWSSGTASDSEDTMRFAMLTGVRPMIEKFPLEKAAEAYERMNSGHAQFRVVLTM
jgi:D-arabinose 1-dehydrogenase-like Zn-dependent alcohol dehydrogenase